MAVPTDITLKTLQGSWVLDKSVADDADSILKLQGVGWLMRKAIGAATLTLHFKSEIVSETPESTTRLTMSQTLTGGISGATEERVMDWVERARSNHIYGDTMTRSRFINGEQNAEGKVCPALNLESQIQSDATLAKVKAFLTEGNPHLSGDAGEKGYKDLYIHDFGRNETAGWTAEQVWAFEDIDSKQYLVRRVVVIKGQEFETARLVYKFSGV